MACRSDGGSVDARALEAAGKPVAATGSCTEAFGPAETTACTCPSTQAVSRASTAAVAGIDRRGAGASCRGSTRVLSPALSGAGAGSGTGTAGVADAGIAALARVAGAASVAGRAAMPRATAGASAGAAATTGAMAGATAAIGAPPSFSGVSFAGRAGSLHSPRLRGGAFVGRGEAREDIGGVCCRTAASGAPTVAWASAAARAFNVLASGVACASAARSAISAANGPLMCASDAPETGMIPSGAPAGVNVVCALIATDMRDSH